MKTRFLNRIVFWLPRLISLAAIVFMSLFALDAFHPDLTIWQQLGGFLMHMIPSFLLLGLLIVAWKREIIGGILFIIGGIVLGAWIYNLHQGRDFPLHVTLTTLASMALPFVIAGILFIVGHRLRRKQP